MKVTNNWSWNWGWLSGLIGFWCFKQGHCFRRENKTAFKLQDLDRWRAISSFKLSKEKQDQSLTPGVTRYWIINKNIKLRVCVVKKMCGQNYVWTDQHTGKVNCPKMKLRVYSTLLTSFVFSSMLKSLCLSLFDNFDFFLTDRQTDRQTNRPKRRS